MSKFNIEKPKMLNNEVVKTDNEMINNIISSQTVEKEKESKSPKTQRSITITQELFEKINKIVACENLKSNYINFNNLVNSACIEYVDKYFKENEEELKILDKFSKIKK